MHQRDSSYQSFIQNVTDIVEENLLNDEFGVNQLSDLLGISRFTLHRKLNEATGLSTSQFIRNLRLEKARELLLSKTLTVSEVAYKVGFGSPVYFSKCFHDHFGYPPVKTGNRDLEKEEEAVPGKSVIKKIRITAFVALLAAALITVFIFLFKPFNFQDSNLEKSVVFIYPKYEATDSTYLHLVYGTVDAIANNLSLIRDVAVYPMSSVSNYRGSLESSADIAREIGASYAVESVGFAYSDKILLNIKLINAKTGIQIWADPNAGDIGDMINLPQDIARRIAGQIHAQITPEEIERIEYQPTQSTSAWKLYLKGGETLTRGMARYYSKGDAKNKGAAKIEGIQDFQEAIGYYKEALEHDPNFALAYARIAISYYLMDVGNDEGKYDDEINRYSEMALINDNRHDLCLIAKAYYYINREQNRMAIPYLERAVLYNPSSTESYRQLANIYNLSREANPEKYLEYKLMVVKQDNFGFDSIQSSEDMRLAARAFRVTGFFDEAEQHIDRSIELNPGNFSAIGEKTEIILDRDNDYEKVRDMLLDALSRDSTNISILRYLFTNYFLTEDYGEAYYYYRKIEELDSTLLFLATKDYSRLTILFKNLGMEKKSEECFSKFKGYNQFNYDTYISMILTTRLHCLEGNIEHAIEQLKKLNQLEYHFSYTLRMLKDDPVFEPLRKNPVSISLIEQMENKFDRNHERIQKSLGKKGLL